MEIDTGADRIPLEEAITEPEGEPAQLVPPNQLGRI